jgi:hypothetical protein
MGFFFFFFVGMIHSKKNLNVFSAFESKIRQKFV